jgi:hypothetical protein
MGKVSQSNARALDISQSIGGYVTRKRRVNLGFQLTIAAIRQSIRRIGKKSAVLVDISGCAPAELTPLVAGRLSLVALSSFLRGDENRFPRVHCNQENEGSSFIKGKSESARPPLPCCVIICS